MELPDLAMTIAAFIIPPILFGYIRSRARAFVYCVVSLWLLMVAGGQYHLAYTPDYDSMAPAISIFAGWLPASIYSGLWLALLAIASPASNPQTTKRVDAKEELPESSETESADSCQIKIDKV